MKVLLVGNYQSDNQESMLRFASMMERGLKEAGHEVQICRPKMLIGRLKPSTHGVGKWLGYVDKFAFFPPMLAKSARWADVIHICDHSNAMYAKPAAKRPVVVTCHDMLAVRAALGENTETPCSRTGKVLQSWILSGLQKADELACVSGATAQDVARILRSQRAAHQVILNGLNYPYAVLSQDVLQTRLAPMQRLRPGRYLLHVGSNLRRKNREGVIRVFSKVCHALDLDLVFAGHELTPELLGLGKELGCADRMIQVPGPSNEMLEALYNSAFALFFPSHFEGFGWPLVEAQACGCPVICSRCPSFEEIVAGSALVREVEDEGGFAADITRIAQNPDERNKLKYDGLKNAQRFRTERMISAYISLYEDLIRRKN